MRRRAVVPALLVAMPLLIIGVLAFRESEADRALLHTEQSEAAAARLRAVTEIAAAAVDRVGAEAIASVASALSDGRDAASALRALILSGAVEFATAEDADHRQFPSENSAEPLLMEQRKLQALAGALAGLRAEMAALDGDRAKAWMWIAQEEGRALLHCRRQPSARTLCVVLGAVQVSQAVRIALDVGLDKSDLWTLAVTDAAGEPVWGQTGAPEAPITAALRLAEPLQAWQAEARRLPGAAIGDRHWPAFIAIIAPLLASWITLAWIFHRMQRTQLEESQRRAEIATQLSHDLRTPLANLRLYAELIARKADNPGSTRDYCRIVEEEIARLSLLADNAVAIAKGEAAEMAEHGAAIPQDVIHSIINRLRPLLDAAGCTATMTAGAAEAITFDLSAYERIVTNFLDNARKYAPGSAIDIATWVEDDRLMVSVRDYGPGLPHGSVERLFTARKRGSHGGFGLGLATIRRLARANGGDAQIGNAGPGTRVTAWIRWAPVPQSKASPCIS